MRRKTVGGRRRSTPSATPSPFSPIPLLSSPQDDHNATVYDSESDGDHPPHAPLPDSIPEPEPVDLLDENTCICCNEGQEPLLVCTQGGCPVTLHVSCIGSEPKFDDSGNFYCPYCWYKQALNKSQELRQKAVLAKKALSSFLDESQTARKDDEERAAEPKVSDPEEGKECFEVETEHDDKAKVSVTGSSVSETIDSDSEASSAKKGKGRTKAKRRVHKKVASAKKYLLRERNTGGDDVDEEVTSSRTLRSPKQVTKPTLLTGKRKRLLWTAEEEKALKEGVLKFSMENQNIPWRKILEFGCRVFDKTRTPVDLKDKWKNITSKEGCR